MIKKFSKERYGLPYLVSEPAVGLERWPLLCFLHGRGEAAPVDIEAALTRHGPLKDSSSAQVTKFIVIAPQLQSPGGDVWLRYADALQKMVQALPNVDPSRRYLTGFSFGGDGVLDIAPQQVGFWAALWAVDPTRGPQAPAPQPIWLSAGECARPHEAAFRRVLDTKPRSGGEAANFVYEDRHLKHVATAAAAYADDKPYKWLLSKRLE